MVVNVDDGLVYQEKPKLFQYSQFKARGWTSTLDGYCNEAKEWAMCINLNRELMRRPYSWVVHINHNEVLPIHIIKKVWEKACRKFRDRGIVCLWVREPNGLNKVHYHIIIKNVIHENELKTIIDEAMPPRSQFKWRKRVEKIKDQYFLAHYVVKSRVRRSKYGKVFPDFHGPKRRLFKPCLGMKKIGTIGNFWVDGKTKKDIWNEIKLREKRIAEALENPNIVRLAKHVHHMLNQSKPLIKIKRHLALNADKASVQEWISQLCQSEWSISV